MKGSHFPQLDGMRAAAALLILAHHYWPGRDVWDPTGGRISVDFFFVLSGFLITRSLLAKAGHSTDSRWTRLHHFYRRRAWRLLPLFYVTCAIAYAGGWLKSDQGLLWHLSFLSNFYFIRKGRFIGAAGHLWAIAVEQHFYLLWPLVILFVPKRWMRASSLAMIGLGVLSRACAGLLGCSKLTIDLLTPDAFEALGAGCLLATSPQAGPLLGATGLLLAGVQFICQKTSAEAWLSLTGTELSRSLLLTALIAAGVRGIPGWIGRALGSLPARALGRWSFAIYLSHNFVLCGTVAALGPAAPGSLIPFIALSLTLLWSMTAYYLIERPLCERPSIHQTPAEMPTGESVAVI